VPEVLVLYYSNSGNTEKMARLVEEGAKKAGARTRLVSIADAKLTDLDTADAIVIGTPTYYGLPAPDIITFINQSVKRHGRLDGKVGGAFSSAANIGGGNETAILAILQAMMVHGMVIQGLTRGDHYGPVSIGPPDERAANQCRVLGERVANLAARLKG
jgi:NAD(P)H dehydrogenase (quinone)